MSRRSVSPRIDIVVPKFVQYPACIRGGSRDPPAGREGTAFRVDADRATPYVSVRAPPASISLGLGWGTPRPLNRTDGRKDRPPSPPRPPCGRGDVGAGRRGPRREPRSNRRAALRRRSPRLHRAVRAFALLFGDPCRPHAYALAIGARSRTALPRRGDLPRGLEEGRRAGKGEERQRHLQTGVGDRMPSGIRRDPYVIGASEGLSGPLSRVRRMSTSSPRQLESPFLGSKGGSSVPPAPRFPDRWTDL